MAKINDMKERTANNMMSSLLIHPGEMIKDEIVARGLTQKDLAQQMGVSYTVFNEILNGRNTPCCWRLHLALMQTFG